MVNNNRIEKKLIQLTPMIHFQWNQEGACLRASEVKPKLDKFVLHWLEQQGVGINSLPCEWRNTDESGRTALRYRLRFQAQGSNSYPDNKPAHPLYFAAKMLKNRAAKSVFYKNGVRMTLLILGRSSLNETVTLPNGNTAVFLGDILDALLPAFFALHCFGTRSNKGFGSFSVANETVDPKALNRLLSEDVQGLFELRGNLYGEFGKGYLDSVAGISDLIKSKIPMVKRIKTATKNLVRFPNPIHYLPFESGIRIVVYKLPETVSKKTEGVTTLASELERFLKGNSLTRLNLTYRGDC